VAKVAIALYDYTPIEEGELAMREGDKLLVLNDSDPDWWMVKLVAKKGGEGLVPRTYVELQQPKLDADVQQESPAHAKANERKLEEERRRREEDARRQEEFRRQQEEEARIAQEQRQMEEERRAAEEERRREHEAQVRAEEEQRRKAAESQSRPPVLPTRPAIVPTAPKVPARGATVSISPTNETPPPPPPMPPSNASPALMPSILARPVNTVPTPSVPGN
jgi:actin cytoskeleton-regulatory complex protein SLA1